MSESLLHKFGVSQWFLLSQLCLNLMGELAQMFVHARHAEPLRVEKTTVLAGENKSLATLNFTPSVISTFTVRATGFRLKDVILANVRLVLVAAGLVACSATLHLINRSERMTY